MQRVTLNGKFIGLSAFYFITLALICLDIAFLPLYGKHLGFSAPQISIIAAAYFVCNSIFTIPWSFLADRLKKSRPLIIASIGLSFIAIIPMLWAKSFFWFAVIFYLYAIAQVVIYPQVELIAMSSARKSGFQYGTVRAIGSIGFVITSIIFGMLIDIKSLAIIPPIYVIVTLLQLLTLAGMPHEKHISERAPSPRILTKFIYSVVPFIIVCFLHQGAQGLYYGFFSIWLSENGYSPTMIGIFWMISIVAEVVSLWKGHIVLRKLNAPLLISLSLLITSLRWLIYYFSPSALPVIIGQLLNSATYGLFHLAALSYIKTHTPLGLEQTGIAVYQTAAYGAGAAIGVLVFGNLVPVLGIQALFGWASILALAGALIFIPTVIAEKRNPNPSYRTL